jgi:hypothetical protein
LQVLFHVRHRFFYQHGRCFDAIVGSNAHFLLAVKDLAPPLDMVSKSHLQTFVLAKEVWLNRQRSKPDRDFKWFGRFKPKPEAERLRPVFKSWLDYTAGEN